jgi:hypothetical protein
MLKRARTPEDLLDDRTYLYHVGQLVGAVVMASHQLKAHGDKDVQNLGEKLGESVEWFFHDITPPATPKGVTIK